MKDRILWIDYARGIGIILVVFGHVIGGINSAGMSISKTFFTAAFSLVYGFHMPLFFFLSGIFAEKWLNIKNRLSEKLQTMVWPYFFWSLLQGSINVLLTNYTNSPMTWSTLFYSIALAPIGQFWFLYILFIFYLLYLFLRKFFSIRILFLISIILFLLNPLVNLWIFKTICRNFVFFVSGSLVINQIKIEEILRKRFLLMFSSILFTIIYFLYIAYKEYHLLSNIEYLITAFTGIIFIITLTVNIQKYNFKILKYLNYLGQMSLIIYVAHILASSGFRIVALGLGFENVFGHIIIGTFMGLSLPLLFYFGLDRIDLTKFFFGKKPM